MPDPTAAEIVPKLIIQEKTPPLPVAGSAYEVAKKVSEKVTEGAWREGLELRKKGRISEGKISEKIEQIGIQRDADGKKERPAGSDELKRYNEAKAAAELTKIFIETGYDKLSIPQQDNLRFRILADLKSRPSLAVEMTGLTPAQEKALAERILRDPRYAKEARAVLEGILDTPAIDETAITTARNAQEDAQIEADDAKADLEKDIGVRVTNHEKLTKQYERDVAGIPLTSSSRAIELETLKAQKPTLQTELAMFSGQAAIHQRNLDALNREHQASQKKGWTGRLTADILADIPAVETNLDNAQKEVAIRQASLTKLTDLTEEEKQLAQKSSELETERRAKDKIYQTKKLELDRRTRTLEDLKAQRASQENDLVNGFTNVFESATDEWISKQITEATTILDTELAKLKEKSTNNNERALHDALRDVFRGPERTRKKGVIGFRSTEKYRPIDKAKVGEYTRELLDNGPDPVMKRLLSTRTNPTTGAPLYTTDEIDKIMENKEYIAKMQPEMIKQILGRKQITGGFTSEDIHAVVNSPWGAGMLEQARQSNAALQKEMQATFGADALNRHTFKERFGQLARKKPWLIALLFGIPILAVGAMTMEAVDETINQQR